MSEPLEIWVLRADIHNENMCERPDDGSMSLFMHFIVKSAYDSLISSLILAKKQRDHALVLMQPLIKALETIDAEWCPHANTRADIFQHRDWCVACSEWIYPGEINPAREALNKLKGENP